MRILIAAVGRLKAGSERTLADDYLDRARKLARRTGVSDIAVAEVAESAAANPALRRADEAERLLAALPPAAMAVALDETGESLTSEDLARIIRSHADAATQTLAFLIGGPDGHGEAALARAARRIAFGRVTWPHRLMRVMVAEQIYRAVTILLNHPYHRG